MLNGESQPALHSLRPDQTKDSLHKTPDVNTPLSEIPIKELSHLIETKNRTGLMLTPYFFVFFPVLMEIHWSILAMLNGSPSSSTNIHITKCLYEKK